MCLVKMMGGRIWLENDLNNTSSLHFTARFGLRQKKDGKPPDLVEVNLSGVPVLIVDDNEINRLVFREMISSKGVIPAEAANGEEAIIKTDKAFSAGKPYRLILLDLQMQGGMDGFEVARKIKERPFGTGIDIILLTSVGQKGDTAKCREVGISGYLLKPVGQSELLDAVAMAFSQPPGEKTSIITRYSIQEVRRKLERAFTTVK
jgi:CheY-like chemotaxis protein